MISETKLAIKAASPALLTGLRNQTGVKFSPADIERAKLYALTYTQPRPGVYRVGSSVVDLWHPFCSCKAWRGPKPKRPCIHFASLYLAGIWSPLFNPTEYFRSQGVERPKIKGFYGSVPYRPGKRIIAEIYKTENNTWLAELPSGEYWVIDPQEVKNVFPIYE